MSCYDFPDMVIHMEGCPYQTGGTCYPRPSSEAPEDILKTYFEGVEFLYRGIQPATGEMQRVPKHPGRSIDPHTGEEIE